MALGNQCDGDVGNIDGPNHSLERTPESLSQAIQRMYQLGDPAIVWGGGHGTAYGHYLFNQFRKMNAGCDQSRILWFATDQTGPNSGTGFSVKWLIMRKKKVRPYTILRIRAQ